MHAAFIAMYGMRPVKVLSFGARSLRQHRPRQVGTPFAGRLHPATRAMVGCCINILPLRLRAGGALDVRALVQRVRGAALAAFSRAEAPLPAIAAALGRGPSDPPLYQVACRVANLPCLAPHMLACRACRGL